MDYPVTDYRSKLGTMVDLRLNSLLEKVEGKLGEVFADELKGLPFEVMQDVMAMIFAKIIVSRPNTNEMLQEITDAWVTYSEAQGDDPPYAMEIRLSNGSESWSIKGKDITK